MSSNDILVKLRLAAEEFSQGWKRGLKEFEDEAKRTEERIDFSSQRSAEERGRKIGIALAAGIGASAFAIKKSLDMATELDATSRQIGISTEALQGWRFAAAQAGVQADALDGNVADLTRRIGEAATGNRAAQQAFADLGISFRNADGSARQTEAAMGALLDRLAAISDPAERAALGTKLLGEEYYRLEPLVRGGADGLRAATDELRQMRAVLSEDEIRNLQETNAKFEKMKQVLSARISTTVAENSDAIVGMANALASLTSQAVNFINTYPRLATALGGAVIGRRMGGLPGAAAGAVGGFLYGERVSQSQRDANMDLEFRRQALAGAMRNFENVSHSAGSPAYAEPARKELVKQTALLRQAIAEHKKERGAAGNELVAPALPPTVDPKASKAGGGRSGGGSRTGKSDAEREAERAAKAAADAEAQFTEQVRKSLEAQRDAADVERIRAEQGEVAAAAEQARLEFLRQHPLAVHQTVEELAKALGITKELTKEDRERLQLLIDGADAAEKGAVDAARAREQQKQDEEARRAAERHAELMRREMEAAIMDVADLYEDLFTGGVDRVWKSFRQQGLRIISEVAAQWTLALLSGQQLPSFASAAGGAMYGTPLGTLFGAPTGLFGRAAANDNGIVGAAGYGLPIPGTGTGTAASDPIGDIINQNSRASLLDQAGVAVAANGLVQLAGIGNGSSGANIGGTLGGFAGQAIGSAVGGPLGGAIGAVIGSTLGSLLGGLLGKTKKGKATIAGGDVLLSGNSSSRKEAASGAAGAVLSGLEELAAALGAELDWSSGSVTIAVRKKDWRVDPTGAGHTKTSKGAIDFGSDQEAAVRYAIRNLIEDGVLTGISDAAQRILLAGGDLEEAIEKAVLIESVPRLLRERLDPMGAALDAVYDKFKKLADALYEAGASTEQIAQARELYQLERQDVIDQFGQVAQTLKDFMLSLKAGSNSPLSLRQQEAEAEAALKPYIDQINAAKAAWAAVDRLKASGATPEAIAEATAAAQAASAKIDQQGFTETSQLLLSVSRQMNASSGAFFEDYDRIRQLTQTAINLVERAVPEPGTADPFAQTTASNTTTMVSLLSAINDNLISMGGTGLTSTAVTSSIPVTGFFYDPRGYAAA
ncbi:MAG: hypothetical protein AB7G24_00770 [Novosphingobium sp.]